MLGLRLWRRVLDCAPGLPLGLTLLHHPSDRSKTLTKRVVTGAGAIVAGAALLGTPKAAAESVGFTSPSGNIGCMLSDDLVRCDIGARVWSPPPRPADCPDYSDYGQGILLHPTGPARFCARATPQWARSRPSVRPVPGRRRNELQQRAIGDALFRRSWVHHLQRGVSDLLTSAAERRHSVAEGICAATLKWTIVVLRDGRRSRPWRADVAQLVAHHLAKVRVAGSNPVIRSRVQSHQPQRWSGRVVRQRPAKPCTRVRFPSPPPRFQARLAQRESASLTRKRSLVQSQYRARSSEAVVSRAKSVA